MVITFLSARQRHTEGKLSQIGFIKSKAPPLIGLELFSYITRTLTSLLTHKLTTYASDKTLPLITIKNYINIIESAAVYTNWLKSLTRGLGFKPHCQGSSFRTTKLPRWALKQGP